MPNTSPLLRIKELLDTLAHEMLHAMFSIYAFKSENITGFGHNIAWQEAACAIEKATRYETQRSGEGVVGDDRPCLNLDLGRASSMGYDLLRGVDEPSAADSGSDWMSKRLPEQSTAKSLRRITRCGSAIMNGEFRSVSRVS